jgi:hypothetical protein
LLLLPDKNEGREQVWLPVGPIDARDAFRVFYHVFPGDEDRFKQLIRANIIVGAGSIGHQGAQILKKRSIRA